MRGEWVGKSGSQRGYVLTFVGGPFDADARNAAVRKKRVVWESYYENEGGERKEVIGSKL
jgi:hypothetical protein